jgi:secondary thiamine-phosphate synthase enzyme
MLGKRDADHRSREFDAQAIPVSDATKPEPTRNIIALSLARLVPRMQTVLTIQTTGPGLYEFTRDVERFASSGSSPEGLLTLFVQHTSCSLCIQENADPDVRRDLVEFFRRLVPPADAPSMRWLAHTIEGADDMPAHIKAALTAVSLSIPVSAGRLALGQWQGIYLFEHRHGTHRRYVIAHLAS